MNPIRFSTRLLGTVYSSDETTRRVVLVYDEPSARGGTRPVPVEIRWDGSPMPARGEVVDVPCTVSLFTRREGGLGYVIFRSDRADGGGGGGGVGDDKKRRG